MAWEWDAETYDTLALPHELWGRRTVARLALTGGETVVDAGCGTGRDTAALLDALPRGRVFAVDASASMLERLRARLPDVGEHLTVVAADLRDPLPITEPVDAVMSVAALHWIDDHRRVFGNLAAVLRPGGRLSVDCGGQGNIATVEAVLRQILGDLPDVWTFAGPAATREHLEAAGFVDVDARLRPDRAYFAEPAALHDYLETVVLGAHLARLGPDERAALVHEVARRLPEPAVDYVRLEVSARRAG
ncbi:trans-aconitate methyltransferase [Parafrankia colletiae]|uniref:Trans-aconitate methyltransferase n=1 Tax=Parafrankia colletiae TaxID=573497 RepID=A0A1S1RNG7_9ACTN|nr:class I SAM-dependent methyltransferase [Parafrankia colletiae]MCK9899791.1 methyltransferase domain-containing protein [Frankia sp. Cpl3]OHV46334.1 trans-aconitate methyltransferase [Parafrankia colletiae]